MAKINNKLNKTSSQKNSSKGVQKRKKIKKQHGSRYFTFPKPNGSLKKPKNESVGTEPQASCSKDLVTTPNTPRKKFLSKHKMKSLQVRVLLSFYALTLKSCAKIAF